MESIKIWEIASALGLSPTGSAADAVLLYCENRAQEMLADFPDCANPAELLEIMAAMLGTSFVQIRSDGELVEIEQQYCREGEFGFASLHKDLDGEAFGVTYRRIAAAPGERGFISIIDCRGNKVLRSYFTKWHEVGHLLILTDQQRHSFHRTHGSGKRKDPEESLVDAIAGQLGFYRRFLLPEIQQAVTFAEVDRVRGKLFPEASFQSSANAYVKHHFEPCLLIEAKLGLKTGEETELMQGSFGFFDPPSPKLRVQSVVPSDSARARGLYIPKNFRVPETSIIHDVFLRGNDAAIAQECLSIWEASDGKSLEPMPIRVEIRKHFESVLAMISTLRSAHS